MTSMLKPPKWPMAIRIEFELQTALLREAKVKGISIDQLLEQILGERYNGAGVEKEG